MNRNLNLLEKLLKRKRKHSIKELKEALLLTNDEDLMTLILELLKRELETFNLNSDSSCHSFLFRCFDYLNWQKSRISFETNIFYKEIAIELLQLNIIIDELINKKITIANKTKYDENINQLIRIGFKIDDFIENHYKEEQDKYNRNIYSLVRHLLFDVKSIEFIREIIKEMPSLKKLRNECDVSILEELIDEYVILLKKDNSLSEDLRTIIYYEKVIDIFTKSYHDKSALKLIKNKLEVEYYKVRGNLDLDEETKRRMLFHFQTVIETILENKKQNKDSLIYKYKAGCENTDICDDEVLKNVSIKDYKDLTKVNAFTIDDAKTKCMEDAISFEELKNGNYKVGIYITDVESRIIEGSKVDIDLEKKALQVNIKKQELFPRKLAQNSFSLKSGKNSLVIAFNFEFNKFGEVVTFDVEKAIINVKKNYSYENYRKELSINNEEFMTLNKLFKVVNLNKDKDAKINIDEISKLKITNAANVLVSSYSIFLNEFISDYFSKKKLPFIFKTDNKDIFYEETNSRETKKIARVIQNTVVPIYNTSINSGVDVMNKTSYGCVTNPVREYDAFINQRMIKKFLITDFTVGHNDYVKANHYITYLCHFLEEKTVLEHYLKEELSIKKVMKR